MNLDERSTSAKAIGERNTGRYLTANRAEYAYTDDLARPSRRRRAVTRKGDPLPPPGADEVPSSTFAHFLSFGAIFLFASPLRNVLYLTRSKSFPYYLLAIALSLHRGFLLWPRSSVPACLVSLATRALTFLSSLSSLSLLPFSPSFSVSFFLSFFLALSLYRPGSGLAIFLGGRPKSVHRVFRVRFRARGLVRLLLSIIFFVSSTVFSLGSFLVTRMMFLFVVFSFEKYLLESDLRRPCKYSV